MEPSSVIPPAADDGGAREAESSHVNEMILTESPGEDQNEAGDMQQRPRDAFDDKIDELQQRLVALTADNSPSKLSDASFSTAQEQLSPTRPSQKALGKLKEENPLKQPDPVVSPPLGKERQNVTVTQTSTRPNTSHRASTRPSTRRGSTAPTSQVPSASSSKREDRPPTSTRPSIRRVAAGPGSQGASAASSRRSSFLISPPAAGQTTRPTRGHRRSNTTWPPPTFIPDHRQALQSLQAFSNLRNDILTGMQAEERLNSTNSLPMLQRPTTTAADATAAASIPNNNSPEGLPSQTPPEYANHVPAANIDWTLPSTRRREYEKIDKARRGLRGLLRRLTPRFLRKDGQVGFHDDEDGKGSEAGTVRRFRMDVEDGDGDGVVVEEEGGKSAWWRFGKKMKAKRKGKGKGKDKEA